MAVPMVAIAHMVDTVLMEEVCMVACVVVTATMEDMA